MVVQRKNAKVIILCKTDDGRVQFLAREYLQGPTQDKLAGRYALLGVS